MIWRLALVLGLALCAPGWAQTLPGSADAGRLDEGLRQGPAPLSGGGVVIPELPGPPSEADGNAIRFQLNALRFEGNTVISDAALAALTRSDTGREITLSQLYEIAAKVTSHYRNEGYVLSRAVPIGQKVVNGIVTLQIVEGFVDKIELEGDIGDRRQALMARAQEVTTQRPLNNALLERVVLLINDLPGISARAVLLPSFETQGAADLILQVSEDRADAEVKVDNRGSKFLGRERGTLRGGVNSVFTDFDRLQATIVAAFDIDEMQYFAGRYDVPIGNHGTRLGLSGSYSNTEPGFTLTPFNVEGESWTLELQATHPVIRSRHNNLRLRGSFGLRETETDITGLPFSRDKIRFLRAGVTWDFVDGGGGVTLIDAEISQGLDILDASGTGDPLRTRLDGQADFTKLVASIVRLQPISGSFSAALDITGQVAFSPLLASEEFGYGGVRVGRAFDASELTGDHGLAGKLELRFDGQTRPEWLKFYQIYAFVDVGAVWQDNGPGHDWASSAGIGVRARLMHDVSAEVELAIPVEGRVAASNDGDDPRVFFSLGKGF